MWSRKEGNRKASSERFCTRFWSRWAAERGQWFATDKCRNEGEGLPKGVWPVQLRPKWAKSELKKLRSHQEKSPRQLLDRAARKDPPSFMSLASRTVMAGGPHRMGQLLHRIPHRRRGRPQCLDAGGLAAHPMRSAKPFGHQPKRRQRSSMIFQCLTHSPPLPLLSPFTNTAPNTEKTT